MASFLLGDIGLDYKIKSYHQKLKLTLIYHGNAFSLTTLYRTPLHSKFFTFYSRGAAFGSELRSEVSPKAEGLKLDIDMFAIKKKLFTF